MSKVKAYDEIGPYWWNTIVKENEVVSVRVGDINNGQFGAYVKLNVRPNSTYTLYIEMEKDGQPYNEGIYGYENEDLTMYMPLAEELLAKYDAKTLAATVLKLLTKEPDGTPIKLTGEAPVFKKERKFSDRSGSKPRNGRAFNRKEQGANRRRNNDRRSSSSRRENSN